MCDGDADGPHGPTTCCSGLVKRQRRVSEGRRTKCWSSSEDKSWRYPARWDHGAGVGQRRRWYTPPQNVFLQNAFITINTLHPRPVDVGLDTVTTFVRTRSQGLWALESGDKHCPGTFLSTIQCLRKIAWNLWWSHSTLSGQYYMHFIPNRTLHIPSASAKADRNCV
jgi:hypothetical protein